MLEYATKAEIWPTGAPANAAGLTLHANLLVGSATKTTFYKTDTDGFPTDAGLRDTLARAVRVQAQFWESQGLDPAAGPAQVVNEKAATGKTIGGATINYSESLIEAGKQAQVDALTSLCPTAHLLLDDAGLLSGRPVRR